MYVCLDQQRCFVSVPAESPDECKGAILFLHGAGMDHHIWSPVLNLMTLKNYALLVPDLPGHGETIGPALTTIDAMAEWIIDLIHALELPHVILVGHSMGSLIALEITHRRPERVAGVVLAGSAYEMPVHPKLLELAQQQDLAALDLMVKWGVGSGDKTKETPDSKQAQVGQLVHQIFLPNIQTLYPDLYACHIYRPDPEKLESMLSPCLMVCGTGDRMTPQPGALRLYELFRMPHRNLLTLDTGHMMLIEGANDFVRGLEQFVVEQVMST